MKRGSPTRTPCGRGLAAKAASGGSYPLKPPSAPGIKAGARTDRGLSRGITPQKQVCPFSRAKNGSRSDVQRASHMYGVFDPLHESRRKFQPGERNGGRGTEERQHENREQPLQATAHFDTSALSRASTKSRPFPPRQKNASPQFHLDVIHNPTE